MSDKVISGTTNKVGLHKVNMIDRNTLNVSGVLKVLSANLNSVCLKLKDTDLIISGAELSINAFSDNNIEIVGIVDCIKYTKTSKGKEKFLKRIFK